MAPTKVLMYDPCPLGLPAFPEAPCAPRDGFYYPWPLILFAVAGAGLGFLQAKGEWVHCAQ